MPRGVLPLQPVFTAEAAPGSLPCWKPCQPLSLSCVRNHRAPPVWRVGTRGWMLAGMLSWDGEPALLALTHPSLQGGPCYTRRKRTGSCLAKDSIPERFSSGLV